jgi:hypothetical protein
MGERYQLDVIFTESYWDVRPLSCCHWAFDRHMIYFVMVVSSLFFVIESQFGAAGDCVDGSEGWEIGALLDRLLILWWRLRWIVWFCFWLG